MFERRPFRGEYLNLQEIRILQAIFKKILVLQSHVRGIKKAWSHLRLGAERCIGRMIARRCSGMKHSAA